MEEKLSGRSLEDENNELKKLLVESMLDNAMRPQREKMVTPVVKRQAVAHLCQAYEVSQLGVSGD